MRSSLRRDRSDPEAPAPFTGAKIKQILETPTNRMQELLMVQSMMWAGPRVSENIARAWKDIDLGLGQMLLGPVWDALRKLDAVNQHKRGETVEIVG